MTALANKDTARNIYTELINGRRLDRLGDYVAADYQEHEPFPGLEGAHGHAAFRGWHDAMTAAFPDWQCEVEHIAADGDLVMAQITIRGTHTGELFGIPPTGKTIELPACDVGRFEDGKVVEHWGVTDQLALLQQLGVAQGPSQATEVHRAFHDAFNERRISDITAKLVDGTFLDHARHLTMKSPGDVEAWLGEWTTAFSDAKVEDRTYYAAGDRSICVFTARGTHDGPLGPFPATGNRIEHPFCEHLVCDENGTVTGMEVFYDQMSMLVQLGLAPAPPAG